MIFFILINIRILTFFRCLIKNRRILTITNSSISTEIIFRSNDLNSLINIKIICFFWIIFSLLGYKKIIFFISIIRIRSDLGFQLMIRKPIKRWKSKEIKNAIFFILLVEIKFMRLINNRLKLTDLLVILIIFIN